MQTAAAKAFEATDSENDVSATVVLDFLILFIVVVGFYGAF